MAGKPSAVRGGVIRTYGRLHPLRRLQQQTWLSPVTDRNRLFSSSSSSSSSHLSSTNNASDDSDFLPPKRRKKVVCKKKLKPPDKPAVYRKKRKKKSQQESRSEVSEKENDDLPSRNSDSPLIFSTPFQKFVTFRRKAPAIGMNHLSRKPKRAVITPLSSDLHDFEVKRRKLCTEVISILDSSMDTLCSPLQNAPLLSSTPSVLLTALPRTNKSFVRQLALCQPLEESVVVCSSEAKATDGDEKEALLYGDITKRVPQLHRVDQSSANREDKSQERPCSEADKDYMGTSELESAIGPHSANVLGSGVKCMSVKVSRAGSPLCILSPVSVSSSESLICLDKSKNDLHNQEDSHVFCASAELFSAEDLPHTNDASPLYGTAKASVRGFLVDDTSMLDGSSSTRLKARMRDGSSSTRFKARMLDGSSSTRLKARMLDGSSSTRLKASLLDGSSSTRLKASMLDGSSSTRLKASMLDGSSSTRFKASMLDGSSSARFKASMLDGSSSARFKASMLDGTADEWKYFRRKSFQPVVKLYSDAVSEHLQRQTKVLQETCPQEGLLPRNVDVTSLILPMRGMSLSQMQPVVQLDRHSVNKYFKDKNLSKTQRINPLPCLQALDANLASPTLQMGLRTPLVTLSVTKRNVPNSAALQETTGRKVCISGFSVKRWGNQRKKTSKAQQQLSFQDCGDTSVFRCKENVSVCGALSPLHFSSSLLTSSFLNSTAVKDLDLSTECFSIRDPQKDHQRWARLRAALSLHRKKKVEAGLPSSQPTDRKYANQSAHGNYSSLLLLSPFQSSLCCDELTDAEKVLAECQQEKPITFQQCLTQDQLSQCQKVGEGVYGEVFRTLRGDELVALKIIPIEGSQKVNGEHQKSFAEILPEIIISKELSLLSGGEDNKSSGFIKLHSAYCVRGCYPMELLAAWDEFADEKGTENERPDLFAEEQLFMILEFEFGGDDLERMSSKLPSVMASRSILHQVTAALAVAEEELRFEHRDLHWGNLLIETCLERTISASLQGKIFHIPTAGVQVKIIDYTLSRLDKDGLTVFCDLSTDEDLFVGEGDLQFHVYRGMREENQNSWSLYRPHSNVLWLHYLCDKLLSEVKYVKKPTSASYQRELRRLRDFRREVRQFSSATDILQRSKLFN